MGEAVGSTRYTPRERTHYRTKLQENLETFDSYLQKAVFVSKGTVGLELEFNLVDEQGEPALCNEDVLEAADDADLQSEIGAYNVEINLPVMRVRDHGLSKLEQSLEQRFAALREAASAAGAVPVSIGTLPTVTTELLEDESWMTAENRYKALSNAVIDARGEYVGIDLDREDHYTHEFSDIAPESTCTSMQLHLQVAPNRFADVWNASQAIAGVQVAMAANSPLFLGRRLWHESRLPIFAQSIDTRTPELVHQGVRPRVWFGERWITSVFDLFEENVSYFPPLLPETREASGKPIASESGVPLLHELRLHNGTVWRWNRPIYAPGEDSAHIRIENRILPAGPSVKDMVADAAFYYGLVSYLVNENRPVWSRMTFAEAHENFENGARDGIGARVSWPKHGTLDVTELVLETLAPQAREGLEQLEVDEDVIDEFIGIYEERARTGRNGAWWQRKALDALAGRAPVGSDERAEGLRRLVLLYAENQATGAPVHTWELPSADQLSPHLG
ncbi:hypothetical protein [Brevibacterium album]|uniref:hypothetical protein n=1 Tax=Brevibacterium album TaxID=417948 RepID=UPI0003F8D118|nr:hypothetical protein [Brevibacterium album]